MLRRHSRIATRSAFTMIELMIVILIIAVLVSLLASAVTRVLYKIPETQTRVEISEFEVGIKGIMNDYQLRDPPPSYLVLYENLSLYATSPFPGASQSYVFLQQMFGKTLGTGQAYIDWNGDGLPDGPGGNAALPWILEGEQCLIFYLGGIPTAPGLIGFAPQGFSSNNINPSVVGGKRKGPYFTFQMERLVSMAAINAAATAPIGTLSPAHPVYLDPWKVKNRPYGGNPHASGWPYAFFSTFGTNNAYVATHCANLCDVTDPLYNLNRPLPYASTQYLNSSTYQILSAGRDGVWGYGSATAASLTAAPGQRPGGADDQSNFSSTKLGAGQN